MTLAFTERASPNCGPRACADWPDMLILHYTGMRTAEEALDRLCDPHAQVSCHYLIDEGGKIWRLVPDMQRAWHAGLAEWESVRDVNGRSIGIELANPGHEFGYRSFPETQIDALIALCGDILRRYCIAPSYVLGHADVAPGRKADPGELFPWARLAEAGIGLFPPAARRPFRAAAQKTGMAVMEVQSLFHKFGYMKPESAPYAVRMQDVIMAFQRHWRQSRCDGVADAHTIAILQDLIEAKAQEQGTTIP